MSQSTKFKSYGDWLFEDDQTSTSIIYKKRQYLTESDYKKLEQKLLNEGWFDSISNATMDMVQLGLTGLSFVPGVSTEAGIANLAISIARGDWLGSVLGLIGLIPVLGDATEMVGRFLRTVASGAGRVTQTMALGLTRMIPFSSQITAGMTRIGSFIAQHASTIVNMFRSAAAGTASTASVPTLLRPIQSLLSNERIIGLLRGARGSRIAQGIESGFSQLTQLMERGAQMLSSGAAAARTSATAAGVGRAADVVGGGLTAASLERAARAGEAAGAYGAPAIAAAGSAAPAKIGSMIPQTVVAENILYTDTRFKKLAGII